MTTTGEPALSATIGLWESRRRRLEELRDEEKLVERIQVDKREAGGTVSSRRVGRRQVKKEMCRRRNQAGRYRNRDVEWRYGPGRDEANDEEAQCRMSLNILVSPMKRRIMRLRRVYRRDNTKLVMTKLKKSCVGRVAGRRNSPTLVQTFRESRLSLPKKVSFQRGLRMSDILANSRPPSFFLFTRHYNIYFLLSINSWGCRESQLVESRRDKGTVQD